MSNTFSRVLLIGGGSVVVAALGFVGWKLLQRFTAQAGKKDDATTKALADQIPPGAIPLVPPGFGVPHQVPPMITKGMSNTRLLLGSQGTRTMTAGQVAAANVAAVAQTAALQAATYKAPSAVLVSAPDVTIRKPKMRFR